MDGQALQSAKSLISYNRVSERILSVRLCAKSVNICTLFQVCAPTTFAEEIEIKELYGLLQDTLASTPRQDIKIIMDDVSAWLGYGE